MADNLPLIPEKGSVCTDVRPILRSVFSDLDYLPPLIPEKSAAVTSTQAGNGDKTLPAAKGWIKKYQSECKEIWTREGELKHQHAKRISRQPLPNIYRLYSPEETQPEPKWRLERGLINRKDLIPTIEQNAGRDGSLWIKNILNRSSCAVSIEGHSSFEGQIIRLPADDGTVQSISVGAVEMRPQLLSLAPPPPQPQPDYMVCVPPQLDFVNFTIGQLHSQGLRLVNISKFEIQLSVRPPKRRELDVEITGPRGLKVTSGAAAELRVHFRPSDVREVRDTLLIRVSLGKHFVVPIACYMQPPILDIMVPSVTSSVLSCTLQPPEVWQPVRGGDVLELGARLLGAVHCVRVLLHCDAENASFFMLTEDAWLSLSLDCLTSCGSVVAGPFVLFPAWWSGGGAVRGYAWCRADRPGLHAVPLRVLSSTAVVRHLHVLADVLLFRPDHLSIEAHEKDYDICGDGEPSCEYYVHLGTAFPHRSLSASVPIINHSPVVYSYYWSVRPWSLCSCWQDEKNIEGSLESGNHSERLCVGAMEARTIAQQSPEAYEARSANAGLLRVEPARGQLTARSSCALHVHVPDVGARLGVQRAVLMLILKDIPRESLPSDYDPMIVSVQKVESQPIPGVKSVLSEVCEVVAAQVEVWWHVAPLRFALGPPALALRHSRRLTSVVVNISATQLFGCEGACVTWQMPADAPAPPPMRLAAAQTRVVPVTLPLPSLPNYFPETDIITMVAANDEWRARCSITRQCATRHPSLTPARAWLGIVPPKAHMDTMFQLVNDTYQHIYWWAEPYRWIGENLPRSPCLGRPPCERCRERACSCGLLRPARGAVAHGHATSMAYDVNAPAHDGCVVTLVQARRTGAGVCMVPAAPACEARAALVAYRVLAPRLLLRLLPCAGTRGNTHCRTCKLDVGAVGSQSGTAMLRPLEALTLGRCTCYRIRITNITPLPTAVHFDRVKDAMDTLKVKFTPNDFSVKPYGEIEVKVILEARKVCGRRLFVYRADVLHAYKPLYLIIDTAISGVQITCEVPLGGALKTDSFVIMRRTQKEEHPWHTHKDKPSTPEEIFAAEDKKKLRARSSRCSCPAKMMYIPPVKRPEPPKTNGDEYEIIPDFVLTPPKLSRVCPCAKRAPPVVPEVDEPICLQFIAVPLRTVRTRTLVLRNESVVTAHWSTSVRRWPRTHVRTLGADQWSADVRHPGVALQCSPARGVLPAHACVSLHVRVYADSWGLYYDQLLIQIENVDPIVLDVWIEAVGPPLHMALQHSNNLLDVTPSFWMSSSDPERVLRAKNVSRSALTVHAYVARAYEYPQDALPLRLYLRWYDLMPRTCPCISAFEMDNLYGEKSDSITLSEDMDTGFELYLAPDFGPQDDEFYTVSPEEKTVQVGESVDWAVTLIPSEHEEQAPDVNLVLRIQPVDYFGPRWHRPEPRPLAVRVRQAARAARLEVSCREKRVRLCALDLPYGDVLRVRKRFHVSNVGTGPLTLGVQTAAPWSVLRPREGCGGTERDRHLSLHLEPRSCVEMCVEVEVQAAAAWPPPAPSPWQAPAYSARQLSDTPLHLYDNRNLLMTVSLILDIEYPVLSVAPDYIDFGFVTDGDFRKTFFSVSHSSRTVTLDLATEWLGSKNFKIWPPYLKIPPGGSANVYLQYTAVWRGMPEEGCACVWVWRGAEGAGGGAGGGAACGSWCRAAVVVRAAPTRDHKWQAPPHDHTDDPHLLPHCLPRHLARNQLP